MTKKNARLGIVFILGMAAAFRPGSAAPIKNILLFTKAGYFLHVGGIQGCTTAMANLAAKYGFTVKNSADYNDLAVPSNSNEVVGWIKTLPNQGRFLYTALGHEAAEWTANDAWLTKMTWAYMKYLMGETSPSLQPAARASATPSAGASPLTAGRPRNAPATGFFPDPVFHRRVFARDRNPVDS